MFLSILGCHSSKESFFTSNPSITNLSVSAHEVCAVDAEGGVWCWGDGVSRAVGLRAAENPLAPARLELPRATAVSINRGMGTILLADGSALTWDSIETKQIRPISPGRFVATRRSARGQHFLDDQGKVWALWDTLVEVLSGAGALHEACASTRAGELVCWRDPNHWITDEPRTWPLRVRDVGGAAFIDEDGRLHVGSGDFDSMSPVAGLPELVAVADSARGICVMTVDAEVLCGDWAEAADDQTDFKAISGLHDALEIDMDGHLACARTPTEVVCWGELWLRDPPRWPLIFVRHSVKARALVVNEHRSCAVDGEQGATCWGPSDTEPWPTLDWPSLEPREVDEGVELPDGRAVDVASNEIHSCRLSRGEVVCRSHDRHVEEYRPPVRDVIELGAGQHHVCALERSGDVACWGPNVFGELGVRPEQVWVEPKRWVFPR